MGDSRLSSPFFTLFLFLSLFLSLFLFLQTSLPTNDSTISGDGTTERSSPYLSVGSSTSTNIAFKHERRVLERRDLDRATRESSNNGNSLPPNAAGLRHILRPCDTKLTGAAAKVPLSFPLFPVPVAPPPTSGADADYPSLPPPSPSSGSPAPQPSHPRLPGSGGEGGSDVVPFISSNPAIPIPPGETIHPLPATGDGNLQVAVGTTRMALLMQVVLVVAFTFCW